MAHIAYGNEVTGQGQGFFVSGDDFIPRDIMSTSLYPGGHAGDIDARIDRQDIAAADKIARLFCPLEQVQVTRRGQHSLKTKAPALLQILLF